MVIKHEILLFMKLEYLEKFIKKDKNIIEEINKKSLFFLFFLIFC